MTKATFLSLLVAAVFLVHGDAAKSQSIYEGFTEPKQEIRVAAIEIGRIEELNVEVGQRIKAGQVVAKLEDSLQQSAYEIAKIQAEMTGELEAASAEENLQLVRVKHIRELAGDKMARPNELLRAEADMKIATAKRMASIEQQQLKKVELEQARVQVERRKVVSPTDGIVAEVFHRPGEYISPSNPAVIRVLQVNELIGAFNVPAHAARAMRVSQRAKVFLRSSAKTVIGRIKSIAPMIEGQSGTVRIEVLLDNSEGTLLAGDRCTLQVLDRKSPASVSKLHPNKAGNAGMVSKR